MLVADEPTTGLDPDARDVVLARPDRRPPRRGAAVLVVTHEVEAFDGLADRVVGMRAGRLGPAPDAGRRPAALACAVPPPPGEPLLALEGLHFAYRPGEPVLRGAGLSVAPGETLALTGPSGCGKTTLARCALRLLDPAGGARSRFDGTRHHRAARAPRCARCAPACRWSSRTRWLR